MHGEFTKLLDNMEKKKHINDSQINPSSNCYTKCGGPTLHTLSHTSRLIRLNLDAGLSDA